MEQSNADRANAIMRGYDTARAKYEHPVATRETVERVDNALRLADQSRSYLVPGYHYAKLTRAALTAAGFTVQEGA